MSRVKVIRRQSRYTSVRNKAAGLAAGLALAGAVCAEPALSTAPEPARRAELTLLVRQDCGSCHGLTLKGGLGPALTREALAGKPPEGLRGTILYGRPGTPMPPWRGFLTEAEAGWLVDVLTQGRLDAEK